jgi:hypothetical protein
VNACSDCGLDMELVGTRHRCPPHLVAALQARQTHVANDVANANAMANSMANEPRTPGLNRASPTYRYRNPTKRRHYMATYMRAYRKRATVRADLAP